MLAYLFLKHDEQFYNHPSTASSWRWSNLSRWMFRGFNEVSLFISLVFLFFSSYVVALSSFCCFHSVHRHFNRVSKTKCIFDSVYFSLFQGNKRQHTFNNYPKSFDRCPLVVVYLFHAFSDHILKKSPSKKDLKLYTTIDENPYWRI